MTRKTTLVALALTIALSGAALAGAPVQPPVAVDLAVVPADGGSYVLTATLTDAASGTVLSAPRIQFAAGGVATATTGLAGGDELRLEVSEADGQLTYRVELHRPDGTRTPLQTATIRLAG